MNKKRVCIILLITAILLASGALAYVRFAPYHWSRKVVVAIDENDIEKVEQLLQKNFDVNTPDRKPNLVWDTIFELSSRLPLTKACLYGNYDMIKLLVDYGATASYIEGTGFSPMFWTLWEYQPDDLHIVQLLLENGADVDFIDKDRNAILLVAFLHPTSANEDRLEEATQNRLKIFELLENNGADINYVDPRGNNAVIIAASWNNVAVLQYLIEEKGFNVNYRDNSEQTALMTAALSGKAREEVVKILLENGADKSLKDEDGKTAYDYAMENGNEEFAELLMPD